VNFQYKPYEHDIKTENQTTSHKMTNNTVLYSDDETTKKKTSYIQKSLI